MNPLLGAKTVPLELNVSVQMQSAFPLGNGTAGEMWRGKVCDPSKEGKDPWASVGLAENIAEVTLTSKGARSVGKIPL